MRGNTFKEPNVSALCVAFVRLWHQRGTTAASMGPWPLVWFVSA